jgi:ankyrin repeat protein
MADSRIAQLFKNLPANYPRHLEREHPHILSRLMDLWESPEFDSYLNEVLIDTRGGRSGFSLKVVAEIMFINKLHNIFKHEGLRFPETEDTLPEAEISWQDIPVAAPTPRGFLHAIEHGNLEAMAAFLDAGVTANYRFEGGRTPLIAAAINGQLEAVRFLLNRGAKVNLHEEGGYTALHWAAYYDHRQTAAALIDAGAAINITQHTGDTPLSLAVTRIHVDMAKLLLECHADPNIAGNHGLPLAIALRANNPGMADLLKQFGAMADLP